MIFQELREIMEELENNPTIDDDWDVYVDIYGDIIVVSPDYRHKFTIAVKEGFVYQA